MNYEAGPAKHGGIQNYWRGMEKYKFSLITNVLEVLHVPILVDWLDFFDWPPGQLVTVLGGDPLIELQLNEICFQRGIEFTIVGRVDAKELKEQEPDYLVMCFEAAKYETSFLVHLDTLPFREVGVLWQSESFALMNLNNALYMTGSTRLDRDDVRTSNENWYLTKKLSNNFLMIKPKAWLHIYEDCFGTVQSYGRWASEAMIERCCLKHDRFGLRAKNRREWRVFHTQEWGPRIYQVRDSMIAGDRVDFFLNGFEDEFSHPWDRFYGYKKMSSSKLILNRLRAKLSIRTRLRRFSLRR